MSKLIKSALTSAHSIASRIDGVCVQKQDIEQCIFQTITLPNLSGYEGYPNAVRENLDRALLHLEKFNACIKQAAHSNNKHIDVLQEELTREDPRDNNDWLNGITDQIQKTMATLNPGDYATIVVRKESSEEVDDSTKQHLSDIIRILD